MRVIYMDSNEQEGRKFKEMAEMLENVEEVYTFLNEKKTVEFLLSGRECRLPDCSYPCRLPDRHGSRCSGSYQNKILMPLYSTSLSPDR